MKSTAGTAPAEPIGAAAFDVRTNRGVSRAEPRARIATDIADQQQSRTGTTLHMRPILAEEHE